VLECQQDLNQRRLRLLNHEYSKKISEINSELEDIATTKKLRDKDGETNLDIAGMPLDKSKRVGVYKIKGKEVSKQEFLDKVRTTPVEELDALNPEVRNDTESKSILDELFTGGLKSVKEQFQELDNTERQRFIDEADGDEATAINLFQKSIRENLFDDANKISDNLFLREQGDTKRENQQRDRITTIATNAAKSISKLLPQVKIVMHNSAQDFNNVTNKRGAGFFSFDDNTIHVNLEDANLRTVPHEVFHAVLFNKLGEEGVASSISNMVSSVRRGLPKNSKIYKRVDEFARMYEEDEAFVQDEERMSELFGIMSSEYKKLSKPSKNAIIKFIQDIARKFGILDVITDTDEAVIDLMNTLSEKVRKGEELVEGDVKTLEELDNGTNPIGKPTTIRKPKEGGRESKNTFKESHKYSLITPDKSFDFMSLINDIADKKQKVWFWVADQLGIDKELGIDAGPSFAYQKEGDIWASSVSLKRVNNLINQSDYLFIISGSPTKSHLFNKNVFDLYTNRLGNYETFKKEALNTNPTKPIRKILSSFNSWEELRSTPKRKDFLIALNQQSGVGTKFNKYVSSLDGFIDPNSLRDGFYRDNDYIQGDVMLVLKPTDYVEGSNHSTYSNTVLGEVVGVPDIKVDAFDLMPEKMVREAEGLPRSQRQEKIAPKGIGVREISKKRGRQQKKAAVTPETSSNYANLTEDGNGNFVFYHVGQDGYETIKPSSGNNRYTGREEASALSKVGGLAMFYPDVSSQESMVTGNVKYEIKVPMDNVYDYDTDPMGYKDEAKRIHDEEHPGKGYTKNDELAYVTRLANSDGFDMVVSEWSGGTRAQTTKELTPTDKRITSGGRITQDFDEVYESNKDKGFVPVIPKTKSERLREVYRAIYDSRNKEGRYDKLYHLKSDYRNMSQDEITQMIESSDINSELKAQYRDALKEDTDVRRSVVQKPKAGRKQKLSIKEIESPTGREQRSRIEDATENGQRIVTDSDITLFRGTKPKMKNGKPFSVHKIKKGKFAALDRNISLGYKGDKPLKIFEIPSGTTVEVVRLPTGQGVEGFRRNEENAIDASDAQVVKLITYDASGKEDQYIIKDDDLLAAVRDETPQEEQEQNQRMAETPRGREQKGLINFTEKDAIKYSKIGIEDDRTIQAMNNIGLSGVKFTKEGVEGKIKEGLNKLYNDYDSYLISKDSNGITTQIQNEIDGAEDLPPNIVQQLKDGINNESFRKKYIDKYRETQDETARQWVSYLKESEYSDAFKYLILDAVLTNNYDLKTLKYKKRTNTTIRNVTPFDAGTLATLYVSDSKNLLKSYIEVQQENLKNIIKASQVDKMGKGRWLKFDGGPNAQNLSENANSLSQLVQDTYWCTKSNALSQLRDGDFYVYVTGDSPRIAIRMEGDKVGEVRGNASSKQDIEPDMLPIADKFLREKIPNDSGKKWLDSIEFNNKAKAYLDKIKSDGIGDKEIIEYANILAEGSKYNTDYGENGFITRIKSEFKNPDNIKPEIREYVAMGVNDFNPNKTKHILGDADFRDSNVADLGNLQSIGGNAYFIDSNVTDLGNLQSIGGYAIFGGLDDLRTEWTRRQSEGQRGRGQKIDRGAKKRIKSITGQIKNYKNITLNEKQLLVKRFRDLNEGAKNLKAAQKLATKMLLKELSDLRTKGTISTRQLEFILRRFSRVNLLNEDSISKFVEYMANVFENVEYAEKISKANKKKKTAFKNASKTKGIPSGLSIKLKEVFAVNPTMIPKSVLDKYMKLIDMFGDRAVVLSIPEQPTVNKMVDDVLNKIREEESIIPELKARFDGAEKVTDEETGKIDYAATLKDMLKEQKIIDEDDLELMKKYKSLIFPREKATPKTDEEIQAEVDELVDDISKQEISKEAISDLPDRERRDAARKLKSLLKGELLSQLGVSDLKNISKLINLINNGYYPSFADVVTTKLSGLQVDGAVKVMQNPKPLPLEKIARAFSISRLLSDKKRSSIYSMIVNNPSAVIDTVIGNFKTQEVFETLFKPIRQAIEGYKRDYKDINYRLDKMKKRVQESLGRGILLGSRNAFVMSKYKQMTYLIQKEFENNPDNPKVHQASEFIKKTIATIKDGKSNFSDYDARMLQEILDTYSDENGNINSKKLYDSFNDVEKESIELIREINNSLLDKAEYTSTVIRGQEFESYNDYIHRIVIRDDNGSTDFNIEEYSNGMMISTRGKSLISRTKGVSALDFDVYRSVERGSKSVLMDYYLTPAVRIGRSRLKNIKKKLMGDNDTISNDLQREVYNATNIAFEEELESLLENTYQSSAGLGEQTMSLIKKNGYRAMLAGLRVIPEFVSNITAASILDRKALIEGFKNQKIIFSEVGPKVMKNLKSTMLERVYPSSGLSGRFVDEDVSLKTLATRGNAKNKVKNVLLSSWDNTAGRWTRSVGEMSDKIISKPDEIVNKPFWIGSFIKSFKEVTGKEPDFDKIAMNDEAYMNEYKTELDAATKFADNQTKSIGAAKGEFIGIAANRIKKGDAGYLKFYKTFNGFMSNFIINDYVYARKAILNLVSRGEMSKKKAGALLASIVSRNMVYFIMGHYLNVMLGELAQKISGEDDEEEKITFTQVLGKALAQTFNTYLFGRNAGNVTRSLINIPVEELNKKFGQPLRTGEYDPYKDAIGFVIKSGKAPYEKAGVQDYLIKMAGAYQPFINTVNLIGKQAQDGEKKKEDAIYL